MVLDFDIDDFIDSCSEKKPPYTCPVESCKKIYKTFEGIRTHMNREHAEEKNSNEALTIQTGQGGDCNRRLPIHQVENMSFAESRKFVHLEINGHSIKWNIDNPLPVRWYDESPPLSVLPLLVNNNSLSTNDLASLEPSTPPTPNFNKTFRGHKRGRHKARPRPTPTPTPQLNQSSVQPKLLDLPSAIFRNVADPVVPSKSLGILPNDGPYIRWTERSCEELAEAVEYDMDEEDVHWLELVNEIRNEKKENIVSADTFEFLMDRIEKEAYFRSTGPPSIDEDAVCSICGDGECHNLNAILFCDMCNQAVHQECYGVPYIPEGQWLCRRCLQSPSNQVECVLCPNRGGAFKRTVDDRWAHVVCALWVPEVTFANTVFLEPIDNISKIPSARWKLTCYICKQRGGGACIQCHRHNCYTAFHVTCAQQAGLYMRIEGVRECGDHGTSLTVKKTAFCHAHAPPSQTEKKGDAKVPVGMYVRSDDSTPSSPEDEQEAAVIRMRRARKILARRRSAATAGPVSQPCIPADKLSEIAAALSQALDNRDWFVARVAAFWRKKREARCGVPLLRRLQATHMTRARDFVANDRQLQGMRHQLQLWQRLRQDLERARLLIELIRKRERLKREELRLRAMAAELRLQPLVCFLRSLLDQLAERDSPGYFSTPVTEEDAPGYSLIVKKPMDLSTMRRKTMDHEYSSLKEFSDDLYLMLNNCCTFNPKDSVYYRAAVKLRDFATTALFPHATQLAERIDFCPRSGLHAEDQLMPILSPSTMNVTDVTFQSPISTSTLLHIDTNSSIALEQQLASLEDRMKQLERDGIPSRHKTYRTVKAEIHRLRGALGKAVVSAPVSTCSSATSSFTTFERIRRCSPRKVVQAATAATSAPVSPRKASPGSRITTRLTRQQSQQHLEAGSTIDASMRGNKAFTAYRSGNGSLFASEEDEDMDEEDEDDTKDADDDDDDDDDDENEEDCTTEELLGEDSSSSGDASRLVARLHGPGEQRSTLAEVFATDDEERAAEAEAANGDAEDLEALDLVWAKCRGYPHYPGLLIDANMPREGYAHNGVPIPVPPLQVLQTRPDPPEEALLVLFFDQKRTWQWLTRDKLASLGLDAALDREKLAEARRTKLKTNCKKAYLRAIEHLCKVTGRPYPYSNNSSTDCNGSSNNSDLFLP